MFSPKHYYLTQQGTGLPGFQGLRSQRGHGFFGRLFSGITSFIKDLAPSIGKKALPSAVGLAQDILSGENVLHSAKNRMKEAGKNIANETLDVLKNKLQKGQGIPYSKRGLVSLYSPSEMNINDTKVNKRKTNKRKKY